MNKLTFVSGRFLLLTLLLFVVNVHHVYCQAQSPTYNSGDDTWYSYYYADAVNNNHRKDAKTRELNIFPPTNSNIKFQYFASRATKLEYNLKYQTYNNSSWVDKGNTGDNWSDTWTDYVPVYPAEFYIDENSIKVQIIDVSGLLGAVRKTQNVRIPLKKPHVRLNNSTSYGVTELSNNFDNVYTGNSSSYVINFRSFLSATSLKMKVVSDEGDDLNTGEYIDDVFKIIYNSYTSSHSNNVITFISDANKCGYQNANTGAAGTPINASNVSVTVVFNPKKPGTRKGKLVFYDDNGTNNIATVKLTGTGIRRTCSVAINTSLTGINSNSGNIQLASTATCTPSYSGSIPVNYYVTAGSDYISVTDKGVLSIKKYTNTTCSVKVEVAQTDYYTGCSDTKAVTMTKVNQTLTISDITEPLEGITSAAYNADGLMDKIRNKCSSNYPDAKFSIVDDPTGTVAKIVGGKFTGYKVGQYEITVKATTDRLDNESVTVTKTINIPYGTITFNNAGDWTTNNNWSRTDILPNENHDVEITNNCTIPSTVAAVAHKVTIGTGGSLTLKADPNNSASLYFEDGDPLATVEMYMKGTTHDDGIALNPDWQYRGFIGENPKNLSNNVLVYKWNETNSKNKESGWENTNGSYAPWVGYSMANMTDTAATRSYQTTLIHTEKPTNDNIIIKDYTFTYQQKSNPDDNPYHNNGVNIVTNSFSVPLDVSKLVFHNTENAIYFFQTTNYHGSKSHTSYVACPSETCTDLYGGEIAAGQSFLAQATYTQGENNGTKSSISVPYSALMKNKASGAFYAPAERRRFNILGIRISSDSIDDELFLLESDECTRKYDNGYDGMKMFADGLPQIYAKNRFGNTSINADSSMLGQYIGFRAIPELTEYEIMFDIDRLEGFDELYLFDRETKHYANILSGETYRFTATEGDAPERFQIMGRRDDGSYFTGDEKWIEVAGGRALIHGFDNQKEVVSVIDMMGKVIWSDNTENGPWFDLPDVTPGVYVVRCGNVSAKFFGR